MDKIPHNYGIPNFHKLVHQVPLCTSKYLCKLTSTQCSYFLLILTLQISPHYATSCSDSLVVH